MLRALLVLMLLIPPNMAASEVYMWVDEKGKKHFSDKKPDSQKEDLSTVEINPNVVETKSDYRFEYNYENKAISSSRNNSPAKTKRKIKQDQCAAEWKLFEESKKCFEKCTVQNFERVWTGGSSSEGGYSHIAHTGSNMSGCGHCVDLKKPKCRK